jgi:hypothetical protein
LKNQLGDIVSQGPKLTEYLSLKRRRLVSINSQIKELKEDRENYPKNALIYLMGLTNTAVFGARQALKRGRMNLTWRWKADDIKKNLEILDKKTEIKEKDSPWTIGLKKQIKDEVKNIKEAYVNKQKESIGMAA